MLIYSLFFLKCLHVVLYILYGGAPGGTIVDPDIFADIDYCLPSALLSFS